MFFLEWIRKYLPLLLTIVIIGYFLSLKLFPKLHDTNNLPNSVTPDPTNSN